MLSTTLAYALDNDGNFNEESSTPEDWYRYLAPGVEVSYGGTDGYGLVDNFGVDWFGLDFPTSLTWTITGLPAHTMVKVDLDKLPETFGDSSDTDTLKLTVGSSVTEWDYGNNSVLKGVTGNAHRWTAHDSSSLTITLEVEDLEPEDYDDFIVEGLYLWVYNPTVSVTGGGTTSEAATSPTSVSVQRDQPTGYSALWDDPIPATTVNLQYGGSATSGTDYHTPDSTVLISQGATSASFGISPKPDAVSPESDETVVVTAASGTGYGVSGTQPSATVTIQDRPLVSASKVQDGREHESTPAIFRVTRTGSTSGSLDVFYTLGGSAVGGDPDLGGSSSAPIADYQKPTPVTGTTDVFKVTIPAGQESTDVSLEIFNDAEAEWLEDIEFSIASDANFGYVPEEGSPQVAGVSSLAVTQGSGVTIQQQADLQDKLENLEVSGAIVRAKLEALEESVKLDSALASLYLAWLNGPNVNANERAAVEGILASVPYNVSVTTQDGKYVVTATRRAPTVFTVRVTGVIAPNGLVGPILRDNPGVGTGSAEIVPLRTNNMIRVLVMIELGHVDPQLGWVVSEPMQQGIYVSVDEVFTPLEP